MSAGLQPPHTVWATGFNQPVCFMPIYYPKTRISDCWGSAGEVTFYHRNGVCYWRARDRHIFSGTSAQVKALDVHRRALEHWRNVPDNIKEKWNEFASVVEPHKPPFDGSSHITGHNLFVSAYHGFATLENEHPPEPLPFAEFPKFELKVIEARSVNGSVILRCRLWLSGADDCNRYRVLGKVLLTNSGAGCKTSKLRNCMSVPTNEPGIIEFTVPSERTGECQLHLRYLLIDSTSGYRTCYHKLSRLIAIL